MSGRSQPTDQTTETARLARAVVYLRVSTKDQAERGGEAEGFSIPAQREACGRKAKSLDAVVVEEFIDAGESAKTAHRPELQRMLKYVAENDVRYVIVHKVDRLARNRLDDALINMEIGKAGATLVSCTENIDETPSGALMHGIMSSIAEFYSRNLANEVVKGSVEKAKKGGTIGRAPTGYLNVRKYENGVETRTVEIDPERGPLMAWAFEAYATGQWTLRRLLDELTERGLTSPPTRRTPSRPLVVSNFHRLMRHPYYKGIVRYKGVEYEGKHQPLVTAATWQRVQEVLDAQGNAGEKHREHPHYLKGTVHCGTCGSRLIVSKNKGRRGKVYEYFVCIGRQKKSNACLQKAVLIDLVEAKVEDHYRDVQPSAELLERIRSVLLAELAEGRAFASKEREAQARRIRKLEDERSKLLDGYYAGAIPVDLMKREQTRITRELNHANERLDAMSAEFDVVEANLEQAVTLAANWHDAYMRATSTERRLLNQAIFEKLYVDEQGEIVHEYAEPFDLLLSEPMVSSVIEKLDAAELTAEQSKAIDQAWAHLSALWAAEDAARVVRATAWGDQIRDNERTPGNLAVVGGSNMTLMVGAAGLEPTTPSL
ncbi:MAG: recombinase family protein [Acidimicrobiales bacterium]